MLYIVVKVFNGTVFYVFNYLAISFWIVIKYKDIIFEEYSKEKFVSLKNYYFLNWIYLLTFVIQ